MKVKAAVLVAPNRFEIQEFAAPVIREDDALLEVELAGVCSTDVKYAGGGVPAPLPIILGHETCGRIIRAGAQFLASRGLKLGDRVVLMNSIGCGHCYFCQTGQPKFCPTRIGYGTTIAMTTPPHLWGGYAQCLYLAPQVVLQKLPDGLPAEVAVLVTAVLANGVEWVCITGGVKLGDAVLVQGVGQQGLAAIVAARAAGADPIIATGLAIDGPRLEWARTLGATAVIVADGLGPEDIRRQVQELTGGMGADVVVDVTGSPAAAQASLAAVRASGTVVLAGVAGKGVHTPVETDSLLFRGVHVHVPFTNSWDATRRALRLAVSRQDQLRHLITHTFSLAEVDQALAVVARKVPGEHPVKVALDPHR